MSQPDESQKGGGPSPARLDKRDDATPSYDFVTLAGKTNEVLIIFEGQTYRLRRTRNDRLILTK